MLVAEGSVSDLSDPGEFELYGPESEENGDEVPPGFEDAARPSRAAATAQPADDQEEEGSSGEGQQGEGGDSLSSSPSRRVSDEAAAVVRSVVFCVVRLARLVLLFVCLHHALCSCICCMRERLPETSNMPPGCHWCEPLVHNADC